MSGCNGKKSGSGNCCPDGVIFKEEFCGNLKGPLSPGGTDVVVWDGSTVDDYFQGTFEIYNKGEGTISAEVTRVGATAVSLVVPPGNSFAVSVDNPATFEITNAPARTRGKFCITLYKEVLD